MRATARQYAQALFELTEGKSKPELQKAVAGFARHLLSQRKLKLAGKIIENFEGIFNQKNGIVEATVVSRKLLAESEMKKIEARLKEKYAARKVSLVNNASEDIKGGIVIKVGDEILDGSIRGRLEELKKTIAK